jgi:hypothetical protein
MKETFVNLRKIPVAKIDRGLKSLLLMPRERYLQGQMETLKPIKKLTYKKTRL